MAEDNERFLFAFGDERRNVFDSLPFLSFADDQGLYSRHFERVGVRGESRSAGSHGEFGDVQIGISDYSHDMNP